MIEQMRRFLAYQPDQVAICLFFICRSVLLMTALVLVLSICCVPLLLNWLSPGPLVKVFGTDPDFLHCVCPLDLAFTCGTRLGMPGGLRSLPTLVVGLASEIVAWWIPKVQLLNSAHVRDGKALLRAVLAGALE